MQIYWFWKRRIIKWPKSFIFFCTGSLCWILIFSWLIFPVPDQQVFGLYELFFEFFAKLYTRNTKLPLQRGFLEKSNVNVMLILKAGFTAGDHLILLTAVLNFTRYGKLCINKQADNCCFKWKVHQIKSCKLAVMNK